MSPRMVISCHADTGFRSHKLIRRKNGILQGHLDNFAGVYAVMQAFFGGKIDSDCLCIELTYGEETNMEGAYNVQKTLSSEDMVIVVDVTGTPTDSDITIEKCESAYMRDFVNKALEGLSYTLYDGCPDPIASEDESDVYREKTDKVIFLGIPCFGGDYNAELVSCKEKSIQTASEAIIKMAGAFSSLV